VGGVHWVMLDSNHDFAPQARWLEADLRRGATN